MHAEPAWKDFLDRHDVRYIVVPKDSALANILLETPDWRSIYSDTVASAFVRTPATGQESGQICASPLSCKSLHIDSP